MPGVFAGCGVAGDPGSETSSGPRTAQPENATPTITPSGVVVESVSGSERVAPNPTSHFLQDKLAVIDAFHALVARHEVQHGPIEQMPDHLHGVVDHVQGVAFADSGMYFSSTAGNGRLVLITNEEPPNDYSIGHFDEGDEIRYHPGGIQAIADHVAVPLYKIRGDEEGQIRFYVLQGVNLREAAHMRLRIRDKRPYCVGFVNVEYGGNNFYVLAVGVDADGREIRFYAKKAESLNKEGTSDGTWWSEAQYVTWKLGDQIPKHRKYRNNIALVSDRSGGLYFLGMYNHKPLLPFGRSDRDEIDLYRVRDWRPRESDSNAQDSIRDPLLECSERVYLSRDTHSGVSFRYGAGVRVNQKGQLELAACAMHKIWKVSRSGIRQQHLDVDVFTGGIDE